MTTSTQNCVYTPLASSSDWISTCTTTPQQAFENGFSFGEILMITIQGTLALAIFFAILHFWIRGIKVKH